MKKSLTLVFATAFLATGALTAFALRKGENIQFAGNGYQKSAFALDVSTRGSSDPDVKYSADVYGVKTERTTKVSTTFKRGALSNEKVVVDSHDYVIWQNDSDAPIRGISELTFGIENFKVSNFELFMYFSYNHLNLTDILDGKYSDLSTYYAMGGFSYSDESVTFTVNQPQARYFLALIMNQTSSSKNITGGSIKTPCDDEPEEVADVGEYVMPDSQKAPLPADFPLLPNGSYFYQGNGPMASFFAVQRLTYLETLTQAFDTNGYQSVGAMGGGYIYQKETETEGKYKTIVFVPSSSGVGSGDLYFFQYMYYGLQDYMGSDGSWPTDKIAQDITDEDVLAAFVAPDFSETSITPSYSFMNAMPGRDAILISGISTGSESEEAYVVLKAYVASLISSTKFLKLSEYSSGFDDQGHLKNDSTSAYYSVSLYSYNLKASVSISLSVSRESTSDEWKSDSVVIMISVNETVNLAGLNSNLATVFGEETFPAFSVAFSHCTKVDERSESNQTYVVYMMTGVTLSSFDGYFDTLEGEGFQLTSYGDTRDANKIEGNVVHSVSVRASGSLVQVYFNESIL